MSKNLNSNNSSNEEILENRLYDSCRIYNYVDAANRYSKLDISL